MKNISRLAQDEVYQKFASNVEVFLRGSKTPNAQYDKFRDTGYSKVHQNSIFIKAIKRTLSSSGLVYRELGLIETGAVELTVKNSDVSFLKLSEKILIDGLEYYAYNNAVGNKFQLYPSTTGYSKVIIFRRSF